VVWPTAHGAVNQTISKMKLKTERLLVDFFSSDYYKEYDELIHNLSPMLQTPPKNSRLVERLDFRQDLPRGAKTNIYQYIGEFLSLPNVVHPRHRKNDIIRWLTTNSNLNPSFASLKAKILSNVSLC
jgi:hypothetical protein